jgi:hypothetical protein
MTILIIFLSALFSQPAETCKTTFRITDCDNQPVQSATITVERCSDRKLFHTVTDSNGKGSFPLCKNEICSTKVTMVGMEEKKVRGVGDSCSGPDTNLQCQLKICD